MTSFNMRNMLSLSEVLDINEFLEAFSNSPRQIPKPWIGWVPCQNLPTMLSLSFTCQASFAMFEGHFGLFQFSLISNMIKYGFVGCFVMLLVPVVHGCRCEKTHGCHCANSSKDWEGASYSAFASDVTGAFSSIQQPSAFKDESLFMSALVRCCTSKEWRDARLMTSAAKIGPSTHLKCLICDRRQLLWLFMSRRYVCIDLYWIVLSLIVLWNPFDKIGCIVLSCCFT